MIISTNDEAKIILKPTSNKEVVIGGVDTYTKKQIDAKLDEKEDILDAYVQDTTYDDTTRQLTVTDKDGGEHTYTISDTASGVDDVKVNTKSVVKEKVANITVPTKTSDLTDDVGYAKLGDDVGFGKISTSNIAISGDNIEIDGGQVQIGNTQISTYGIDIYTDNEGNIYSTDGEVGIKKRDYESGEISWSHKLSEKANQSDLTNHTSATDKHTSTTEKAKWDAKQDALTFDDTPKSESDNPVKSSGIYTALDKKVGMLNDTDTVVKIAVVEEYPSDPQENVIYYVVEA